MDKDIQIALISAGSAIVGAIIGAAGAWYAAIKTNQIQKQIASENAVDQRRAALEAMILKMNEMAVEHGTLERDDYCEQYPNVPGDKSNGKARYESYVCYVFNVIGAVWDFCGKEAAKTKAFIHVEELVRRHWRCWEADQDNLDMEPEFLAFIRSVKDDLIKRGKIK